MAQQKVPTDPAVQAWLLAAMEERGESQSSLSRRSGVGQTTVGRIMRGEVNPGFESLRRLADALGTSPPITRSNGRQLPPSSGSEPAGRYGRATPGMLVIPHLDVWASMGPGSPQPDADPIVDSLTVSPAWMRQQASFSNPANLAIINALGTSMQPTFNDGDLLIVDRGVTDLRLDAVYVLAREGELFIKRVQRQFDGGLLILSDNPTHPAQAIPAAHRDSVSVLGRVLLALNANKL